jgi:hypothetical protein
MGESMTPDEDKAEWLNALFYVLCGVVLGACGMGVYLQGGCL